MDKTTPIVLLHGFAEDSAVWDNQKKFFEGNYRLIVPDLPGSGSTAPLSADTSMEELALGVKTLLDAEGVTRCIMIGHSMGGYVALAFAELFPERLKALGLFHSTGYADTEEKKATRRKGIEFIRKNGSAPFIRQSIPNLFTEKSRNDHPEWIAKLTERYAGFRSEVLVAYYEAMIRRPDRSHILNNFHGPVLFIFGEQDSAVPVMTGLQQSHLPAIAYIHVLENASHMGMIEESDRVCQILENFLKDHYHE